MIFKTGIIKIDLIAQDTAERIKRRGMIGSAHSERVARELA
jgi:hypothetical protein